MFIFDRTLSTSVVAATAMLNDSRDRFDWKDQQPGVPVLIFSSSKGRYFMCKIATKLGDAYTPEHCTEYEDTSLTGIPILTMKVQNYKKRQRKDNGGSEEKAASSLPPSLRHEVAVALTNPTTSKTEAEIRNESEEIVQRLDENKKRLEFVQAWASINLDFPGFNLNPWAILQERRTLIYLRGPSLQYRQRPALIKLSEEAFLSKLAKFDIVKDMTEFEEHKSGHYYFINAKGIKYIYNTFQVRKAMQELAMAMVQTKITAHPKFEPKLLLTIQSMIESKSPT